METEHVKSSLVRELLIGYCLGAANIIPGVSGGTFLLIFKIYERVFAILGNINKNNLLEFITLAGALIFKGRRKNTCKLIACFLDKNDFVFLSKLMAGAMIAILSLSSLMKYLIVHQFSMTYALFFGLILVSILIPVRMIKAPRKGLFFFLVLGTAVTVYVTWAVNPYDKVEKKSRMYQTVYHQGQGDENLIQEKKALFFAGKYTGKYTIDEYLYASACGAVAISAMVLPGISGSLVLILMGQYFEVVSAISGLRTFNLDDIFFLSCFGLGIVFGGLLFARLVSAVLSRYYDATMAFLTGLMAGSLYALWPFKKSIVMAEQYLKEDGVVKVLENSRIYTNINEVPLPGPHLYLSLLTFAFGCLIMFFFVKKEIQG